MRVALVTRTCRVHGIGGMEDYSTDLARSLAGAGHDVEVVTSRHPEGIATERRDGVHWRFVDAPGGDFTHPGWRAASYAGFVRASEEKPFDVIHGQGSSALELARRGVQRHTPFVVTFHGNFLSIVRASLRRQLARPRPVTVLREQRGLAHLFWKHRAHGNWRVFRSCEVIVPSHQQFRDTCRSHHLDPRRVHVVPNGVDVELFRPALRESSDGFTFIFVGRLDRGKGTQIALQAFAQVRDRAPTTRLVVVGDGPERGALEMLAAELGIADDVRFEGIQPREVVAAQLAAADVFLFPTELAEAAPLVLLQAMASGLPVVASNRGGISEVLQGNGTPGFLVEAGNTAALARRMLELYGNPDLRQQVSERARARVCDSYTLESMVNRTVEVYDIARERLFADGANS